MKEILQNISPWLGSVMLLLFLVLTGYFIHYILFKLIERIAKKTHTLFDDSFIKHCTKPSRWILIVIIIYFALPLLIMSLPIQSFFEHVLGTLIIVTVAWMVIKLAFVAEEVILNQYKIDVEDNLWARKIYTQVHFLKKVAIIIIVILTSGTILMTFDAVRQLGTTILASAGIIGIVFGLAAQRSIGTLLAGLQIAFTQPIRIDDVVIVENEWGRVEEVTLTYVVVRIWDLRRMVLPITYFIENPFQNWTRVSTDILGTVYIYVDYKVPVNVVREELNRILDSSTLWDHNVCALQVTNVTERTMELRALMSAQDSSKLWSLRCEVREKLIEFVKKNYPDGLPKVRAELQNSIKNSSVAED